MGSNLRRVNRSRGSVSVLGSAISRLCSRWGSRSSEPEVEDRFEVCHTLRVQFVSKLGDPLLKCACWRGAAHPDLPFLVFLFPCVFSLRFFLAFLGLKILAFLRFPCVFGGSKILAFWGGFGGFLVQVYFHSPPVMKGSF